MANNTALQIQKQGSYAVGGVIVENEKGSKYRADHAYVSYQIPVNAKSYPVIFAHGIRQFKKTWQSHRRQGGLCGLVFAEKLRRVFSGSATQGRGK